MNYRFTLENGAENRDELEPLYRQHYAEMAARLAKEGISAEVLEIADRITVIRRGKVVGTRGVPLRRDPRE